MSSDKQQPMVTIPEDVARFLLGEGPLEGVWWGEDNNARNARFWWRNNLRVNMHPYIPSSTASRHERRVVGHVSGWQEQMDTCICGKPWPCPSIPSARALSCPACELNLRCPSCGKDAEQLQQSDIHDEGQKP